MSYETIEYRTEGKVGVLTLARPENYNAITHQMKNDLLVVLGIIQNDKNIRSLVITGKGKGFCAGADLTGFTGPMTPYDVENDLNLTYANVVKRIVNLNKPVIAAINGPVAGAGLGFALACDFLYMADSASMRYAFINIALIPDAGSSWFLTQAVGYHKAMQIICGGEKIPAKECQRLGLVHTVAAVDTLFDEALAFAQKLADGPTAAYVGTKRLLRHAVTHGLNDTIDKESQEQSLCILGEDNIEGVQAFLEKRKPQFSGKGYDHS